VVVILHLRGGMAETGGFDVVPGALVLWAVPAQCYNEPRLAWRGLGAGALSPWVETGEAASTLGGEGYGVAQAVPFRPESECCHISDQKRHRHGLSGW
jgi:hypothetical protein